MPHSARAIFVSSRGVTSTPAGLFFTSICSGQVKVSSPFGPFILTVRPSTVAVTPAGMTTGFLPTRDIAQLLHPWRPASPRSKHVAEDLAANVLLARPGVRHHALGSRQDGDAEAVGHARQIAYRLIDAPAGGRHAADLADGRLAVGVFQFDLELGETVLMVDAGVAADVAFVHQHVEYPRAQIGSGRGHLGPPPLLRVADAGEHVAERIVHRLGPPYQLDFTMPGIWPWLASSLSMLRHTRSLR